jgi:trk system potassium uptake protein
MMFVIIVGGGKTGLQLTKNLMLEGHRVKVIEDQETALQRLRDELPAEAIVDGDGSSPHVLESAGIRQAQVLAAVTGQDEDNLVITSLARFEFGVPRIIARVNNPKNAWLYTPEMGVDCPLSEVDILARLIAEEMSLGDMMTLFKLRKGEYSVVEEKVPPDSAAVGKRLKELEIPDECSVAAIIRKGRMIIPRGETVLQPADELLAVAHASQVAQLAAILAKK